MKFWLIVMIFSSEGDFIRKVEQPTANMERCLIEAAKYSLRFTNSGYQTQTWCVSDDHHSGRKQDKGIPFD